ncbi:MAG TPA: PKD domain-containing protein, partial [Luteibaculaceae bacterium]|nr:PKD domain-containing protein [Luteibaculaceae bacterium]
MRLFALLTILFFTGVSQTKAQALTGKDFWFTLPENQGANGQEYYIYVVSQFCIDSAYIELPFFNEKRYFSVEAGEFYRITVPRTNGFAVAYHQFDDDIENKSVHLVSPKPVAVYLLNYSQFTPDGESLIPLDLTGTNYVLSMRGNGNFQPIRNTIIATENNTMVTIRSWDQFGSPFTRDINLNQGETYLWTSSSECTADYQPVGVIDCRTTTGSVVEASKKITVFSSVPCSNIGACGNCDALMTTYLPINRWSNRYVTAQVIQRNTALPFDNLNGCSNNGVNGSGDYLEILGPIGANVSIRSKLGTENITITSPLFGNFGYGYILYEIPGDAFDNGEANTEISSNVPIQVVQYTKGRGIDNNPTADPEALYIFPPTMWQSSYFFYPIYTPTAQNLEITVVVEDIGSPLPSTTILLNGNNIGGGNWVSIPNTNFKYKRISDPEFISSRIESSSGARFGFFFFARNERETAFFSGGYGPLTEVSLCEQCAEADILTEGSFCVNSTIDFNPAIYSFTTPQNLQYSWNFGDGFTSTERSPSHVFNRFGNFPVQLSISDGSCVISTSRFVQVNDISIDATP